MVVLLIALGLLLAVVLGTLVVVDAMVWEPKRVYRDAVRQAVAGNPVPLIRWTTEEFREHTRLMKELGSNMRRAHEATLRLAPLLPRDES